MSRLTIPSRQEALQAAEPLLAAVDKQLGVVPNLFRVLGTSPAVLEGFLGFSGALARTLDVKTRERIALAVAEVNGCDYCLSAHTYLGLNVAKLSEADVTAARRGGAPDAKADAAVRFAAAVARTRGKVSDAELGALKAAGYTEAQVVEIVAVVAENMFTNLVNNVAQTDIDFPVLRAQAA